MYIYYMFLLIFFLNMKKFPKEYKVVVRWDESGISEISLYKHFSSKNERRQDKKINTKLYETMLWFKFFHELRFKELGGKGWWVNRRFLIDVNYSYDREHHKEYNIYVDYQDWVIDELKVFLLNIDQTKSWQNVYLWVDTSKWYKENFTRTYKYDKDNNRLSLQTVDQWIFKKHNVQNILSNQQNSEGQIIDSEYFVMPLDIYISDWVFKISDIQKHFDLIWIPAKIQNNLLPKN